MTTLDNLLALLPDNNNGAIGADDLRSIVTSLWDRVSVGAVTGKWAYSNTVGGIPAAGTFTTDNADPTLATSFRFARVDEEGTDFTTVLSNLAGFIGNQEAAPLDWANWTVISTGTLTNDYLELGVSVYNQAVAADPILWGVADFLFVLKVA